MFRLEPQTTSHDCNDRLRIESEFAAAWHSAKKLGPKWHSILTIIIIPSIYIFPSVTFLKMRMFIWYSIESLGPTLWNTRVPNHKSGAGESEPAMRVRKVADLGLPFVLEFGAKQFTLQTVWIVKLLPSLKQGASRTPTWQHVALTNSLNEFVFVCWVRLNQKRL